MGGGSLSVNYSSKTNLNVSMTASSSSSPFQSVVVNIESIEVWFDLDSKSYRVAAGKNFGSLDLLAPSSNGFQSLKEVPIPTGAKLKAVRLMLFDEGHYAIKDNGQRCDLRTPSGQTSGIKVMFAKPNEVDAEFLYSAMLNFNAEKSVVALGNGDCLLKPVIKVQSLIRRAPENDGPQCSLQVYYKAKSSSNRGKKHGDQGGHSHGHHHDGQDSLPQDVTSEPITEPAENLCEDEVIESAPEPTPKPSPEPEVNPSPTPEPEPVPDVQPEPSPTPVTEPVVDDGFDLSDPSTWPPFYEE